MQNNNTTIYHEKIFTMLAGKFHFGHVNRDSMFCGLNEGWNDISLVSFSMENDTIHLFGDSSIEYPISSKEVCKRCLKKIMNL